MPAILKFQKTQKSEKFGHKVFVNSSCDFLTFCMLNFLYVICQYQWSLLKMDGQSLYLEGLCIHGDTQQVLLRRCVKFYSGLFFIVIVNMKNSKYATVHQRFYKKLIYIERGTLLRYDLGLIFWYFINILNIISFAVLFQRSNNGRYFQISSKVKSP